MDYLIAFFSGIICYVIFGILLTNKLDKLTKFKDDEDKTLDLKYVVLFYFVNFGCFLFLNRIRQRRKFDYYKKYIKNYEIYNKRYVIDDDESERLRTAYYNKYVRELKLYKVKKHDNKRK